jgi:hypothetical protein
MVILLGGGPSWADILTAVGTAVLAVFAIVTTGFAAAAFCPAARFLCRDLLLADVYWLILIV